MSLKHFVALAAASAAMAACSPDAKVGGDPAKVGAPEGADLHRAETGQVVTGLMAQSFNPEQQGRVLNMGYFMAASALCPDLEVDADKLGRAVDATLALDPPGESADQKQHQHDAILMFLGVSTGAMIGAHMDDKAAFCDDAAKLRGGPAESHLFKAGAPTAPSTAPLPAGPAPKAP